MLDTSILVEVDQRNEAAVTMCKQITRQQEAYISIVTVAEILTGSYLRSETAVKKAKRVLEQFQWVEVDGSIADKIAQITTYLMTAGKIIEFQDIVIAATALVLDADRLVTQNPDHFKRIPKLSGIVQTLNQAISGNGSIKT
ncbi:MAG: type II toxin-antitoxin system VapC family toxin [Candidatus Heimdallarchaeota archaeon]